MDPAAGARPPVDPRTLGQCESTSDGRFHLVSFLTTPLLVGSRNDYVVFVTRDQALDHRYRWTVKDEDGVTVEQGDEDAGTFSWTPDEPGHYEVEVTVTLAGAPTALPVMRQTAVAMPGGDLVDASALELRALAADAVPPVPPGALDRTTVVGDLDTTSELLLELLGYVRDAANASNAAPTGGVADRGIPEQFLAAVLYESILTQPKSWSIWRFWVLGPGLRTAELEWAADEVNLPGSFQLTREIDNALGGGKIRMDTAAMVLGGIPWRYKRKDPARRAEDDAAIWAAFVQVFGDPAVAPDATAAEQAKYERRIDLFNLLRFPRTNVEIAARLLAHLKNRRFPALTQQAFGANERARQIVATEYQIGAVEIPAGSPPTDAEPNAYGRRVASLATRPFIATWFKPQAFAAPLYADADLAPGATGAQVTALQNDLAEIGFRLPVEATGAATGSYGSETELAVRELQIHARMDFVGLDRPARPAGTQYSDWLRSTLNVARHGGPVSGVVDRETRRRILLWKQRRWRCPVVVDARNAAGTTTYQSNIWGFGVDPAASWRAHVRDVSRRYPAVGARNPATRSSLGYLFDNPGQPYSSGPSGGAPVCTFTFIGPATLLGVVVLASAEVWAPETEILPEHLLAPGKTMAALSAAERATYKVVRAVGEIECVGYFDCLNAWDKACLSLGLCHWTIGIVDCTRPDAAGPPAGGAGTCTQWRAGDGELCGYLAYLRHRDRDAYQQAIAPYGIRPNGAWGGAADAGGTGQLFAKSLRKFAGWLEQQDRTGVWVAMPRTMAASDWFRNWHWYYRFAMAGRAVQGFRRRMWDMARIRLRDILSTPWNGGGLAPVLPNLTTGASPTLGDVFTSEKAAGLLLRMHVLAPSRVIESGPDPAAPGRRAYWASTTLHRIVANAALAPPDPAPDRWTDVEEQRILDAFMAWVNGATPPPAPSGELQRTLRIVNAFPFQTGRLGYQLQPAASAAVVDAPGDPLVGVLHSTRNSLKDRFDRSGLPPEPDWGTAVP